MQTKRTLLSLAMLLSLATPLYAANPASTSSADTEAVELAVNQFYVSLNALFTGEVAPMNESWSHSSDVTYMGPAGGFQVGWDQVGPVWASQAALKLGGKVEPSELHFNVVGDLAVVNCIEQGNNLDADGQPVHVSIRATNAASRTAMWNRRSTKPGNPRANRRPTEPER